MDTRNKNCPLQWLAHVRKSVNAGFRPVVAFKLMECHSETFFFELCKLEWHPGTLNRLIDVIIRIARKYITSLPCFLCNISFHSHIVFPQ